MSLRSASQWPRSQPSLRSVLRAVVVALVVWGCLRLARGLDVGAVGSALASASLPCVAIAAALNLLQVLVRALVLQSLLLPVRHIAAPRLTRYTFALYAGNNVLPGRGGEWVRVHLLRAREDVPPSVSIAVAVVEKVFDATALLLLAAPLPFMLPGLPRSVSAALGLLGGAGALGLGGAWLVARGGDETPGLLGQLARGSIALRRAGPFARVLALSLGAYLLDAVMVWLCLRAVGIHAPAATPLLVLLALGVALAVPSTPSGIGAFELGAVAALALVSAPPERALAFALVYHVMQVVPVTVLGLDGLRLALTDRAAPARS